jgi:hypothetical protein
LQSRVPTFRNCRLAHVFERGGEQKHKNALCDLVRHLVRPCAYGYKVKLPGSLFGSLGCVLPCALPCAPRVSRPPVSRVRGSCWCVICFSERRLMHVSSNSTNMNVSELLRPHFVDSFLIHVSSHSMNMNKPSSNSMEMNEPEPAWTIFCWYMFVHLSSNSMKMNT